MAVPFDLKSVREKLLKSWRRYDFHRRWLANSLEFPLQVALPKVTERQMMHDFVNLQAQVIQFRHACEGHSGLALIEKEFVFSSIGRQRIPVAVELLSLAALCQFLRQDVSWEQFVSNVTLLRFHFPQLDAWCSENMTLIEEYHGDWQKLIKVCHYFLAIPRPGLYMRQLDIPDIDSKFIEMRKRVLKLLLDALLPPESIDLRFTQLTHFGFEQRYGLLHEKNTLRFRLLDPALAERFCGLRDMTIPVDEFAGLNLCLNVVFITENKVNFLAFPDVANAIVIFGQGYGVQLLKKVSWLTRVDIHYWGDIDTNGFAILSQLRGYFSHVQSLLMDEETVVASRKFWGDEPEAKCHPIDILPFLTEPEQQVYLKLKTHHWQPFLRVEQERIPFHLLLQALNIKG